VSVVYLVLAIFFMVRHLPYIRAILHVLRGGHFEEPPAKGG
jgi:hypothetical protein